MIHGLRQFKLKNICNLCDIISDKDKKDRIMEKICFVFHEEVIDVFHQKKIPTIEKLSFHLAHVMILGSMEYGKIRNDCLCANA